MISMRMCTSVALKYMLVRASVKIIYKTLSRSSCNEISSGRPISRILWSLDAAYRLYEVR
jgi:hypothetical protein